MAKLTIVLPDDVDRELRVRVAQKYGGKKGALGDAIAEAVRLWLAKES